MATAQGPRQQHQRQRQAAATTGKVLKPGIIELKALLNLGIKQPADPLSVAGSRATAN